MDTDPSYDAVLTVFVTYGFRKTSMAELAEAMNVSRQTLYNRFQTKQAVLDWAVAGRTEEVEARAIEALAGSDDLKTRILNFFAIWIGAMVPVLRNSPHGMEILQMVKGASKRQSGTDAHEACLGALTEFVAREMALGGASGDIAHLLIMVSKGLLMTAQNEEEYAAEMARALNTTLRHVA